MGKKIKASVFFSRCSVTADCSGAAEVRPDRDNVFSGVREAGGGNDQ